MKFRRNRRVERAGVNAAQALFESRDWIFQPVDLGNDYGKDAYVDMPSGQHVSGICAALQIKSGDSYRSSIGYRIPIENHERVWRESSLPVMGIVHDPADGQLYWCNISTFLRDHPMGTPSAIPVNATNVLNAQTLGTDFLRSIRETSGLSAAAGSPLDLVSDSVERQIAAIFSAFAHAAVDPRALILVRRLLTSFEADALLVAVNVLSEVERHEGTAPAVLATYRWTVLDILHLLTRVTWEYWQRGDAGEHVYALLVKDSDYEKKVEYALDRAVEMDHKDAMWATLYLLIYWAGEHGADRYADLITRHSMLRGLPLIGDLEYNLNETGGTSLF